MKLSCVLFIHRKRPLGETEDVGKRGEQKLASGVEQAKDRRMLIVFSILLFLNRIMTIRYYYYLVYKAEVYFRSEAI
jgi:hypothetical protein